MNKDKTIYDLPKMELKSFIKWCDGLCYEHQGSNAKPIKHKNCLICWNEIKESLK